MKLFLKTFILGLEISVIFKNFLNFFKLSNYIIIDRDLKSLIVNFNNESNPSHESFAGNFKSESYNFVNFTIKEILEFITKLKIIITNLFYFYIQISDLDYENIFQKYCLVSIFSSFGFKICPDIGLFNVFEPNKNFIVDFTNENFRRKIYENIKLGKSFNKFFSNSKKFQDLSFLKCDFYNLSAKMEMQFSYGVEFKKIENNSKNFNFNEYKIFTYSKINDFFLIIYKDLS